MEKEQTYLHFRSDSGDWSTPQDLFDDLNEIFIFDLDAAATPEDTKCEKWLGPGSDISEDAFSVEWKGTIFLNPPYGRKITPWVKKAKDSAKDGTVVVCLLPARTDTKWFQTVWRAPYVVFVKGRLKFGSTTTPSEGTSAAPFPSVIAVFGDEQDLPPDRELTFLSEYGTVVRPLWHYAPANRVRYETRLSVPFIGTVMEYRKARDPHYELGCPEERAFAKVFNIERFSDVSSLPPRQNHDTRECALMDKIDGESSE